MTGLVLFAGEDVLAAPCENSKLLQAKAEFFRQSGLWEEVVQGMTDLTVKYDPLGMTDEEAAAHFRRLWEAALPVGEGSDDLLVLDASFAENDGSDRALVADRLGIKVEEFPAWLSQRSYRVTMMGFQPGFAYLEDSEVADLPALARLDTPRQRVAAGSIGFLGGRVCIYALDGPGGWPIVGRVREPLFRGDDPQPFLLKPGQILRFRPV
jgi:KipI family sensor histidine kinase inhibitor